MLLARERVRVARGEGRRVGWNSIAQAALLSLSPMQERDGRRSRGAARLQLVPSGRASKRRDARSLRGAAGLRQVPGECCGVSPSSKSLQIGIIRWLRYRPDLSANAPVFRFVALSWPKSRRSVGASGRSPRPFSLGRVESARQGRCLLPVPSVSRARRRRGRSSGSATAAIHSRHQIQATARPAAGRAARRPPATSWKRCTGDRGP
jgi:hypothetical protein